MLKKTRRERLHLNAGSSGWSGKCAYENVTLICIKLQCLSAYVTKIFAELNLSLMGRTRAEQGFYWFADSIAHLWADDGFQVGEQGLERYIKSVVSQRF